MRIDVNEVTKGKNAEVLPPTTVTVQSEHVTFVRADTEQRPTVLGLIVAGRMKPSSGDVTVDGERSPKRLRRTIALIDAPDISDPAPNVPVWRVVSEELMFAGRPAHPIAVRDALDELHLTAERRLDMAQLEPTARVRMLLELASRRPGVEALVLVSPDRHGGDPVEWWRVCRTFAARGYGVLVIAGYSSATAINGLSGPDVSETVAADAVPLFQTGELS
ncbi:hypothetical protein [Paramicrobacterium chengjingii]|uniref:ABC transporter ATP-binding protein n=1 Tax=Paramicrobacterium chengjingii TaxID=2769067 RepID=A0ABX6YH91_9MICO|nr:hypothetical protein [Microbacterium chengjingii]QPZ37755.1 hypothetical protein HCR76_13155 [Microbacterium chengjingii]